MRILKTMHGCLRDSAWIHKCVSGDSGHASYMSCHRDGGASQGDTRHSMPPARRRGGFNFDDQLFPPPRGDGSARAIMA